jgi:hypothetical protein
MLARLIGILDREQGAEEDGEDRFECLASQPRRDGLAEPLQRYRRHVAGLPLDHLFDARDDAAGSSWGHGLVDTLDDIIVTLIAELRRGADAAAAALELSLRTGDHAPQAAIYNAFVMLLKQARETLNLFPKRLVDFYYRDVLRQHELAPVPDQLFLTFVANKEADQASVPRGAVFPAGKDAEGRAIQYAASAALEVAPAAVTGLSVHRVATEPGSAAGNGCPAAVLSGKVEPDIGSAFPMFGMQAPGQFGALTMAHTRMGFCVSSPMLILSGGERTIKIDLVLTPTSFTTASGGAGDSGESADLAAFLAGAARLIEATLALHYSTPGGWITVDGFSATVSTGADYAASATVTLIVRLPADAPPLAAASEDPGPDATPPSLPPDAYPRLVDQATIVGSLRHEPLGQQDEQAWTGAGPMDLLSSLMISDVRIHVEVRDLTQLTVRTPAGRGDTSQNLALFGVRPARGAALSVSAPELWAKPIETLSIAIDWVGLPVSRAGFLGYYRDYVLDADGVASPGPLFDNRSFMVAVSVNNPGLWSVEPQGPLYLFRDEGAAAGAAPSPAAPLAQRSILSPRVAALGAAPAYYNPAASTLRVELAEPALAFGDILYAANVMAASAAQSEASIAKARGEHGVGGAAAQAPTLPNPPWSPLASRISIDYSAAAHISFAARKQWSAAAGGISAARVDFRHVAPFGRTTAPPQGGAVPLLPPVEADAALYIRLSAPVSQVSLLFVLAAGPNGWWSDPPETVWEQYVHDRWIAITVLQDGTGGLSNSGIVTLHLHRGGLGRGGPRIRVRAIGDARDAPLVKSVTANALVATWIGPGGATALGTPLPALTITKSATRLASIASIAQPMPSFGGRPPAHGTAFHRWMAERLRHKGYAIDSWDYARLVLAAVPSLWQTAVIPATDGKTGERAPGKLWVVLVAGKSTPNVTDSTMPLVDLATLAEVGELLHGCVGPFVKVEVTNPYYLRLRVSAEIIFCDGDTSACWERKLEAELVEWLSPWPPAGLGKRPPDYYTRSAVTDFVHGRPYVLGILSLQVEPVAPTQGNCWYYLTSARRHHLRGRIDPARRARRSAPRDPRAEAVG